MKNVVFMGCILSAVLSTAVLAATTDPWFTGPLLFDSAQVTPIGSQTLQLAGQYSTTPSIYAYTGEKVSIPLAMNDVVFGQYSYGLSSKVDAKVNVIYVKNQTEGQASSGFGDTLIELGYQVLTQGESRWRPDFRVAVLQLFPTGRYTDLNPSLFATDATGVGSYQTSFGLNFGLLTQLNGTSHYLKASGSITATYTNTAKLRGNSIYGGTNTTLGSINPGNAIAFDLAGEYTLTQHWVAVIETFLLAQQASDFSGELGTNPASFKPLITQHILRRRAGVKSEDLKKSNQEALQTNHIIPSNYNIGNSQGIGNGHLYSLSLAPALEYNLTENIGLIGGCWFTLEGRNVPSFFSGVLQFNLTW